jgi:hypothetical protein
MTHRIEFDIENRIVLLSFLNIITEDSILAGISEVQNFLKSNSAEATILDFSGIGEFRVSAAFFRNHVNTRRKLVAPDKPRIAVAPQAAVYGMLKVLQAHSEASRTAPIVVRTREEAYEFLKLDAALFGPHPWSNDPARGPGSTNSI